MKWEIDMMRAGAGQLLSNINARCTSVFMVCMCAGLLFGQTAHADHSKEESVKAAILFNLARFSKWSSLEGDFDNHETPKSDKFSICVIETHMRHALATLEGKPIHGLILEVKVLEGIEDITPICKIIYLTKSEAKRADLKNIAEQGILTVSEGKGFLPKDGGIRIMRKGKKMKFSINRVTMETAHIKPSSQILRLSVKE